MLERTGRSRSAYTLRQPLGQRGRGRDAVEMIRLSSPPAMTFVSMAIVRGLREAVCRTQILSPIREILLMNGRLHAANADGSGVLRMISTDGLLALAKTLKHSAMILRAWWTGEFQIQSGWCENAGGINTAGAMK